jgi:hypothetical protein
MKKTKIKGKATYGTVMGAKIRKAMNLETLKTTDYGSSHNADDETQT